MHMYTSEAHRLWARCLGITSQARLFLTANNLYILGHVSWDIDETRNPCVSICARNNTNIFLGSFQWHCLVVVHFYFFLISFIRTFRLEQLKSQNCSKIRIPKTSFELLAFLKRSAIQHHLSIFGDFMCDVQEVEEEKSLLIGLAG